MSGSSGVTEEHRACSCENLDDPPHCGLCSEGGREVRWPCPTVAPWRVGEQVEFRENAEHDRVLGVISRVWSNGRYLTIVTDGRTFVRHCENVTRCASAAVFGASS